jgi:plastocyanin
MRGILCGLAGLVVLLAGAAPAPAKESHQVVVVAWSYVPGNVEIQQGDSVTLVNVDAAALSEGHSVTQFGVRPPAFDSGIVAPGTTGDVKGAGGLAPGTYDFFCQVHPFIRGRLTVKG